MRMPLEPPWGRPSPAGSTSARFRRGTGAGAHRARSDSPLPQRSVWGKDFATAVEKAARIDGDSDPVAARTGMFLGAAGGTAVLPPHWCAAVRDRDKIESIARALAARSGSPALRWRICTGGGIASKPLSPGLTLD